MAAMNTCHVSGWVQGAPELRITKDGRRVLNFEMAIEGPGPREPYAPVAYRLAPRESVELKAGDRVFVTGPLRHHRTRGLFVGATEIMILACDERERDSGHAARPSAAEGDIQSAVTVGAESAACNTRLGPCGRQRSCFLPLGSSAQV
jgi:hypothetical protein